MPAFDDWEELAELIDARVSMLPGDGEPEDHIVEQIAPSKGAIERKMEQAREGHRIAEEDPERGAYHGGAPLPDMGGVTIPYDQRANAPSLYKGAPMQGHKMRVQSFEEAKAEIAEGRAEIAKGKAQEARAYVEHAREDAEQEASQLEHEADVAEQNAREGIAKARPSGF